MPAPRAPAFEIWRESAGIPHIRAKSDAAAWEGLGCVHVRDRLFQMDLRRRRASGRVAEWTGPEALPGDRLARRAPTASVGWRRSPISRPRSRRWWRW
ncbi:penicillin acylase family protein [Salipiger thiooxidans]|nr:penicillin acylase family protein [Salipiger thiooxidans]